MAAILQTTFSNSFTCKKDVVIRLKFAGNMFSRIQLTIIQHWFRKCLGAKQETFHYLNQWWPSLLMHICITWPWWVKSYLKQFPRDMQLIDQSHRYGRPQAACREPAGSYDKTTRTAICFEHKTQYLLIRAPYTRIVVFWHISNISPMISQSQISCNTPTFYLWNIAIQPAVGCYNPWANLRCSAAIR